MGKNLYLFQHSTSLNKHYNLKVVAFKSLFCYPLPIEFSVKKACYCAQANFVLH